MSGIPYVGRYPDSDGSLVHKQYVDTRYGQIAVNLDYVNAAAASVATNLVTSSYVDAQDALRAKKSDVDMADGNYVPLTQRGVANGIATIGSDGFIPTAQLPTLQTDRVVRYANYTTLNLSTRVVTTTSVKEYLGAVMSISDPGYPYFPLIMGSITGFCSTQSQIRRGGGGSLGKMVVYDQNDILWGGGIAAGSPQASLYGLVPITDTNVTPLTRTPIVGASTMSLWLSLWSGSTYTFNSTDFTFYAILFPGA